MGMTLAEKSARITCVACAVASDKVKITKLGEDIKVEPADLLEQTFAAVLISQPAQIETFKKAVCELLPLNQKGRKAIQASVMARTIDPQKRIKLFSRFLEALMAEQEAV